MGLSAVLPSSHTNPVFVLVGDRPIRASRRSAEWCLDAVDVCWEQKKKAIRANSCPPLRRRMTGRGRRTGRSRRKARRIDGYSDAVGEERVFLAGGSMRVVAAVAGLALIVVVLSDCFQSMILPRRVTWRRFRPAIQFYRSSWALWRFAAHLLPAGKRREGFLSVFGPLSLPALFILWAVGLIFGFALLQVAVASPLNPTGEPGDLLTLFYLSGETFFTLGYGDVTTASPAGRLLSVAEAGLGFGFMAVIIGYLPVLYQAFSRREVAISLLDARAGSPPSVAQLLLRLGRSGAGLAAAAPLLAEWERWSAELLESHLSFPVLSYYRSQHDNQSWLAALTVMLDASALLLGRSGRRRPPLPGAADVRRGPPRRRGPGHDVPHAAAAAAARPSARRDVGSAARGVAGGGVDAAGGAGRGRQADELRGLYEPFLNALAEYLRFALPPVRPDRTPVDNWQTSAWMRRGRVRRACRRPTTTTASNVGRPCGNLEERPACPCDRRPSAFEATVVEDLQAEPGGECEDSVCKREKRGPASR